LIAWLKQRLEVGLLPSEQIDGKILEFIRQGILYKQLETSSRGKTLTTTRLRRDHPAVERILGRMLLDPDREPVWPLNGSNVIYDDTEDYGDVDEAFAGAHKIVRATFHQHRHANQPWGDQDSNLNRVVVELLHRWIYR